MTRGCLNIALSETYCRNVSVFLMAIPVRLVHRQVSLPLRRCRIYLLRAFGLIWKSSRAYKRLFAARLFSIRRKHRKVDRVTLRKNERNIALMNGQTTLGRRNTLSCVVIVNYDCQRDLLLRMLWWRKFFLDNFRKKKWERIPSSLPDWCPSCSVSPISATCSPGNSRFIRRIRVKLAVHASANCYWKKGYWKKEEKEENGDKPLSTLADWNVVYAGASSTGKHRRCCLNRR